EITSGQLIAFYVLAAFLFPPMRRLARVGEIYQESMVALERIARFLDRTRDSVERPGAKVFSPNGGAVSFRGVALAYGRRRVLKEINLEVAPGEMVAVVGPNGAGKSTLMSLLPRFVDPDTGSVLVDGQDVRDLTLDSLRRAVAIVPQDPFLFSGTIRDNIRYGKPEATDEEISRVVQAAQLKRLLKRLPHGLDTKAGERGLKLSGGERQRIAIARALLLDPAILVMDEATSGVDQASDTAIGEALERLLPGRTAFVIAHRLTTTRRASRVLVMNKGRIVEDGTHEQLMRLGGAYSALFNDQFVEAAGPPTVVGKEAIKDGGD
ncbi:MAG TPA: ABC transporter ATP-binding protein, partial [Candidatus Polarisedimenticolia bacterium]|nr:ABC transporter ATP-binding protein [Candidatus Polarisedimenticolia bacterium]